MIVLIRSSHPAQFHSGEWAEIVGVAYLHSIDRPCFKVRFIDGDTDLWAILDPDAKYEFKPGKPRT